MALEDFDDQACLCVWVRSLGDAKPLLQGLLQSISSIVQSALVVYKLTNNYTLDNIQKQLLETSLEILDQTVAPVEIPLNTLVGYTAPFSDCPPVATLASAMKSISGTILSPVEDLRNEVKQYIKTLEDSNGTSEFLESILKSLEEVADAIDRC